MAVTVCFSDTHHAVSSDVLVVLRADDGYGPRAAAIDRQSGGVLSRACVSPRPKGACGEVVDILAPAGVAARRIVVLGLGASAELSPLALVRAGAALASHLEKEAEDAATLLFDEPAGTAGREVLSHLVLGMRLQNYRFVLTPKGEALPEIALTVIAGGLDASATARLDAVAEGVALARTLVNYPASHLNPDTFGSYLAPLRRAGVEVEELDALALEALGMGAILAVGRGSARAPRVFVLRWKGAAGRPIALVGKGMCFDAGGLCIKTGPQMAGMKADMAGAAAVIGTLHALALQKAPLDVVGVVGVAENMLGGAAYKPGDIITTMSGRTVEVYDTDCEGRMVLADILHHAATRFEPAAIVDLATLTYSVMRGLGHVFAGLFASDDRLAAALLAAGEATGERLWRLPLDPAYDANLRSQVADLRQHGRDLEDGDAPTAAAFLRNFVEGRPWVHLDIAGKELIDEDRPMARAGATGFGVRLLEEWLHRHGPEIAAG